MSKKLIIPRSQLPDINILTKGYQLRYRVTTEDRNRFSAWTPIFLVQPEFTFEPTGEIIIEKHTGYSKIVWNPVIVKKDGESVGDVGLYDIWVRWGTSSSNGTWEYKERTSSTSIDVLKPTSPGGLNHLSVELYFPGRPRLRKATYDIFQSNAAGKINLTTDVITLPANVFKTGYPIRYKSTDPVGGLTDNTIYYARMLTATTMTLHPTESDAVNDTNKIDITSHKNAVGFFTWEDCPICDFFLYGKYNFSPV
jgi:hypothetical protein